MRGFFSGRFARPTMFPVLLIAALTLISAQRTYAVTTTANAALISWGLNAGGESLISLPVRNTGVHVMATCTTVGDRGIAAVDIMAVSEAPPFLMWSGQHSDGVLNGAVTANFSAANEVLIAEVGFAGTVELEVANAAQMAISNEGAAVKRGTITMFW